MKKETTAQRLKYLMDKHGYKQADVLRIAEPFCKRYGVKLNRSDLSQYISGKFEPKQDKLTILSMVFNTSEAFLMGLDVPEDNVRSFYLKEGTQIKIVHKDLYDVLKEIGLNERQLRNVIQYAKFIKESNDET